MNKQHWIGVTGSWDYENGSAVKEFVKKLGAGNVICTRTAKSRSVDSEAHWEAGWSGCDSHVFAPRERNGKAMGVRDGRFLESVEAVFVFWNEDDDNTKWIIRRADKAGKLKTVFGRDGEALPDDVVQGILEEGRRD